MADIRCFQCGEPWDMDCIHDIVSELHPEKPWLNEDGSHNQNEYHKYYSEAFTLFRRKGCEAFDGGKHSEPSESKNNLDIYAAIYDILGDDVDGIVSEIEDAEYFGILD